MIFVLYEDADIRAQFERELPGACAYYRADAEVFGEGVSHEDYMNRRYGFNIPFYRDIFRKNVAKKALENEYVILECDPDVPDWVEKCPVIYITDRTEGNDEAAGQLPVKFTGNVAETVENARKVITHWLETYGDGREEKEFYRDFYEAAKELIPDKLRLTAVYSLGTDCVVMTNVDFSEERAGEIAEWIQKVEDEAKCKVFVDDDTDQEWFNIEDYYFATMMAKDIESFYEKAKYLRQTTEERIQNRKH